MIPEALLSDLNQAQQQAVRVVDGALLVVAGAGTGKTRVITRRIAALMSQGIDPHQILAITFTNKAAGEMRDRVEHMVGRCGVTISTYHSFCARFLRQHAERLGYSRDFSIYDRDELLSLFKKIIKELNLDKERYSPSGLISAVSAFKQDGQSPSQAADTATNPREKDIARAYQAYELRLRQSNAMDFDDLLVRVVHLLKTDAQLLQETQNRYRYLLVDEYQDTNHVQYEIVKLIGGHGNVCVTGDPDQSIYTWRGADIRNILEFEKDFPDATVVLLEENYRSTGHILSAASAVIQNNLERKERGLWTQGEDGPLIRLTVVSNEKDEAREVARHLREHREQGGRWTEHAVFYRTNAQTRILERVFREEGIPYRLVGAVSFFKRKEVKDLLAYLTLWVNPKDDESFRRVINTPRRGLGQTSLNRLESYAHIKGLSLFESLAQVDAIEGLTNRAIKPLKEFAALFDELGDPAQARLRDSLMTVIEATSFEAHLEKDPAASERLDNVRELIAAAHDFEMARPDEGVSGFLADVSLLTTSELEEGNPDGVTLMTLHAAKGLEFDHVCFIGIEEDLLPHVRSQSDPSMIEEERRLMYVGITRARKTLHLLRTAGRSQWGEFKVTSESRFLREIPEHLLEVDNRAAPRMFSEGSMFEEATIDNHPWDDVESQLPEDEMMPVQPGDKVDHTRFGIGRVLSVSGRPPALRVRAQFTGIGVRQLIWGKAPIRKV